VRDAYDRGRFMPTRYAPPRTSQRSRAPSSSLRDAGGVIALAAVALIGAVTLAGSNDSVTRPWCVPCALRNPGLAADLVVNFLLFVPLGIGLRLAGFRFATAVSAALAASLTVELLQAYVIPGRAASILDVATNTIGAVVGASAAPRWRTAVSPGTRTGTWLALGSLGGLIVIVAASAWALTPARARVPLTVRGVPRPGASMRAEGVLRAVVDGRAVRGRDTVRLFEASSRATRVVVALQASPPQSRGNPSFRLVAERKRFLWIGIDEERDELELQVRRTGEAVRLLSPSLRVPRPVRRTNGGPVELRDTLVLSAVVATWWMRLDVRAGSAHRELELRLHPLAGWSLLLPNPRSASLGQLLTALWTAALVVPVAYWSAAAAARRPRLIGVAASVTAAVVWAVGAAVGAPRPPWSAVAALIIAVLAARRLRQVVETKTGRWAAS
jgi:hypothetical protein